MGHALFQYIWYRHLPFSPTREIVGYDLTSPSRKKRHGWHAGGELEPLSAACEQSEPSPGALSHHRLLLELRIYRVRNLQNKLSTLT